MKTIYNSPDLPEANSQGQPSDTAEQSSANEGSLTIKHSKKYDIIARVGCILVAFVIWIYVMANDSPTAERTFDSVAVQTTGSSSYSVLSGSTDVSVTVKGRRGTLNQLDDDAVQAVADISGVTSPGWQSVTVNVTSPSGTTVSEFSPSSVLLYFGNPTTITVPVEISLNAYTLPENYQLGIGESNPSEVTVTGPEDILLKIQSARVSISLGTISSSVTSKAPLTLVDKNGEAITSSFVKLQATEATVTIPVYKLAYLPLTVTYKYGYYNSSNVQITVSPETVLVRGESSAIDTAKWFYTVDEKLINGDGQYTVPITLTDGVSNASGTTEATLTIKHIGTTTKQVTLTDIAVINPDGLTYSLGVSSIVVTLRGPQAYLNYITEKNITATIDLSSFKNSTGSVIVPISISVPSGMADSVYELGAYTMAVTIG
jgi:Uncharacterized protein conserved in bacteria